MTVDEKLDKLIVLVTELKDLLLDKVPSEGDWIPERQAAKEFDYSLNSIRRMRRNGTLTKVRATAGGRKVKVSRKECQQKLVMKI